LAFCILLIIFFALPVALYSIGLPSREDAYKAVSSNAGDIGPVVQTIYDDPNDADIVLLGSSIMQYGIRVPQLESELSGHLSSPPHIAMLAMDWQGIDSQYFLIRDYFSRHKTKVVVWNLPIPGARTYEPHVEAFRWMRYGEDSSDLRGLPFRFRFAIYGDMVLGAPRQALSLIRPNRLSEDELHPVENHRKGYYGSAFIEDDFEPAHIPASDTVFSPGDPAHVSVSGQPLDPYQLYFAKKIVAMAQSQGAELVFIHIPFDGEYGDSTVEERGLWSSILGTNAPMVGVSAHTLFGDMPQDRFLHFFVDQHLNANGQRAFTQAIGPAILKVFQDAGN
jgi:hypothetical protein